MYINMYSVNMPRFVCSLLLTIAYFKLMNGQPLSSDHRRTLEAALIEQRVLEQIRPLLREQSTVDDECSGHVLELQDTIQALTTRVEKLEEFNRVLNVTVCSDYLVSGLYGVGDGSLTASSKWPNNDIDHGAANSRLYHEHSDSKRVTGAWSSRINDNLQYIQVQFPRETEVEAILLRGRNEHYEQWVETYHLLYSMNQTDWATVVSNNGEPRLFIGNSDKTTIVKASLVPSITAVFLRINPRSWNNHISLRFDVSGCYTVRETRYRIHKALGFKPVIDDTLYRVNERGHNQLDAARLCTEQYSQLIKIHSLSMMAALQGVVMENDILTIAHNQLYVSGKYAAGQWLNSDDSGVIDSALWSPGNPNPSQGHCVMLTFTGLVSVNCAAELFSVCGHM